MSEALSNEVPSGVYRPEIITAGRYSVTSISVSDEAGYEVMLHSREADPGEYVRIGIGFCAGELTWWKDRLGKAVELVARDV